MENLKKTVRYGKMPERMLLAECRAGRIGCVVAASMKAVNRTAAGFMDFLDKIHSYGVALRLEKEGLTLKP